MIELYLGSAKGCAVQLDQDQMMRISEELGEISPVVRDHTFPLTYEIVIQDGCNPMPLLIVDQIIDESLDGDPFTIIGYQHFFPKGETVVYVVYKPQWGEP